MNGIVSINNQQLAVKEYQGKRVVTMKDIDECHERPDGTAKRNFNSNKHRLQNGIDYFKLSADEIRTHKIMEVSSKVREEITFITETGYMMLVKSFTDDLAWKVQRMLVNTYFQKEVKKNVSDSAERLRIMEMNARTRMAQTLLKLTNVDTLSNQYKNILVSKASEIITGEQLLPLPKQERKTYSATEIGEKLGINANKVGRLSNMHELKTKEYGEMYRDKSRHSNKEVDTWRYYDSIIPVLQSLIESDKKSTH